MAEITVTKENFEAEVLASELPVLVDFWATWCGPCRMLAPALADIAQEYEGKVKVCKVNVDDEEELAIRYRINAIPAVLLFRDGKVDGQSIGYVAKEKLVGLFS